ncbi:b(0,+)-type amino acid transporter 1-like isoform X2 [Ischnura elegans]|nr:b(0,+)-type amino acid transporter 1-like isoform X2 [Ischnura elegans]XP_046385353.1 b(0,+)-type amino acid transporter 1-like isoform X2 [Ischnura elegans]XP_046385354.1 b(0,+)-type amino acid transporter 1-like isoform X2 [Ischnura elegans]
MNEIENDISPRRHGKKYEVSHKTTNPSSPTAPDPRDSKNTASSAVNMKRQVGLLSGIAIIVGTMIGSGIFVTPGSLLRRAGSVPASLIVWVACAVLCIMGALSYAELGTMIPLSGGEHAYFMAAFADLHPFWGPLPAFMFDWLTVVLMKPSSLAALSLSSAEYIVAFFKSDDFSIQDGCESPYLDICRKCLAAVCIGVICFINCYSVKLATRVQVSFTVAKLAAIAVIVAGGAYMLSLGHTEHISRGFGGTTTVGGIASAFYSGLFAYDGWNNLNFVTEELKNPFRNLPRAIISGIPLVATAYLLINIAYLSVIAPEHLAVTNTAAVDFGKAVLGVAAFLMPLSVVMSTFGAANGSQFTAGRICYVASRDGHLVDALSFVHVKRLTPAPALIFNATLGFFMMLSGDIIALIDFFSFTAWIFYGLAMVALLVMRWTKRSLPRPYKVPIILPIIVLLSSIYLIIAPVAADPRPEFLYAIGFIILGLTVYVPFVYYKVELKWMRPITRAIQLLLQVAPTSSPEIFQENS